MKTARSIHLRAAKTKMRFMKKVACSSILWVLVAALPNSVFAQILEWDPWSMEFGRVFIGQTEYRSLTLTNADTINPLTISTVEFTYNQMGQFDMQGSTPLPVALDPGASMDIVFSFAPIEPFFAMADIVVTNSSTNAPLLRYSMLGEGAEATAGTGIELGRSTWSDGNGHTYAFVQLPEQPWDIANSDLQELLPGYHLATVTSAAEEAFIEQLLVDLTGSSGWEWWLGGFQDVEVETDPAADWQWVTGENWGYTDWRDGEPNDAGGFEDHLALDNGGWNDEGTAISIFRGYVAELGTFDDVPADYWAFDFIETLYESRVTTGCGAGNYCPENPVTRAQMAVFLERGMQGSDFAPPAAAGNVFLDIAAGDFAANFIEQLYADGVTSGCGGGNYCPNDAVTRAQMAVFLLRAKHGADYSPPPATGVFADVDLSYWALSWIEQLAAEGITSGCGNNNYCPENPVTRAQMAVFLVRSFGL